MAASALPTARLATRRARPPRGQRRRAAECSGGAPEIGARDPTQAELDSNFNDKIVSHANTDHLIAIPAAARQYLGLAGRPLVAGGPPLTLKAAELLRKQVLDWRLVEAPLVLLRRVWVARDAAAAAELRDRLLALAAGYSVRVAAEGPAVMAELGAEAGVTEADLVFAARTDALPLADLLQPTQARRRLFI